MGTGKSQPFVPSEEININGCKYKRGTLLGEGAFGAVYTLRSSIEGSQTLRSSIEGCTDHTKYLLKVFKGEHALINARDERLMLTTAESVPGVAKLSTWIQVPAYSGQPGEPGPIITVPQDGKDAPALVIVRAPGRTWNEWYETDSHATPWRVAQSMVHVAQTLSQIHALGIAHNDVHSGNVMWDDDTQTSTLIDVGIACFCGERQPRCSDKNLSTTSQPPQMYMDRLNENDQCIARDQFALAMLVLRMCTNRDIRARVVQIIDQALRLNHSAPQPLATTRNDLVNLLKVKGTDREVGDKVASCFVSAPQAQLLDLCRPWIANVCTRIMDWTALIRTLEDCRKQLPKPQLCPEWSVGAARSSYTLTNTELGSGTYATVYELNSVERPLVYKRYDLSRATYHWNDQEREWILRNFHMDANELLNDVHHERLMLSKLHNVPGLVRAPSDGLQCETYRQRETYGLLLERAPGTVCSELASWSVDNIRTIMLSLLHTVQEIHKLGVSHNRVSMENVMFDPESQTVTLLDLSAACDHATLHRDAMRYRHEQWFPRWNRILTFQRTHSTPAGVDSKWTNDQTGLIATFLGLCDAKPGTNTLTKTLFDCIGRSAAQPEISGILTENKFPLLIKPHVWKFAHQIIAQGPQPWETWTAWIKSWSNDPSAAS